MGSIDTECRSFCYFFLLKTQSPEKWSFSVLDLSNFYGRTLSERPRYILPMFFIFFMGALVGQTAERIFTKLSHVVDIRCYLRTY